MSNGTRNANVNIFICLSVLKFETEAGKSTNVTLPTECTENATFIFIIKWRNDNNTDVKKILLKKKQSREDIEVCRLLWPTCLRRDGVRNKGGNPV